MFRRNKIAVQLIVNVWNYFFRYFFFAQFNERCENGTKSIDTNITSPIVILTKHCTVRLDRVSSLDKMINVGTFYLDPIYAQNNHVIDNNTVII